MKRNNKEIYEAIMKMASVKVKKMLNEEIGANGKYTIYIISDDYAVTCWNDDDISEFVDYLKDEKYFSYDVEEFDSLELANAYVAGMTRNWYENAPASVAILWAGDEHDDEWIRILHKYDAGEIDEN